MQPVIGASSYETKKEHKYMQNNEGGTKKCKKQHHL